MTSKEIRAAFLDFFRGKEHHIVPSAPMVIKDDPTLMFTNAGMNQFKDIILGNKEAKYRRVADSQKCLRVSGKHNDLEEVGHDTYHHTMFEMLGNWSFGDYFKENAIAWAWEFLTERLGIEKDRLYVTIFEGDKADSIDRDQEAFDFWSRHIPQDRILLGNKKDNFWEMGDTGPCGPCSEIHIDLRSSEERSKIDGASLVNRDHPQVVEIWNLVFMQYDRKADGHLEPLPHKVIDTGMGFERLCMAIQGKQSNYDTDVFTPLIRAVETLTGKQYGASESVDVAMRVIADHIRTIAFAITDGQLPSNAKAGYVIRRILRRAVRYGYTFLERNEPFLYALVPALVANMGEAYPELEAQRNLIENVIREEEESFLRTLETGMKLLERRIQETPEGSPLSGEDAFTLYDTYGFPLDLTELILREHKMTLDSDGFALLMQQQKDRARAAAEVEAADWVTVHEGETTFVGYDATEAATRVLRYRSVKQKNKSFYQVVLQTTPFYAEMGGQTGDAGVLINADGKAFRVTDTKQENNLPIHIMPQLPEPIDGILQAQIDVDRRAKTEANHTATHLMHKALRTVLGNHVEQKGSFVGADLLRFDFSHFKKLSQEEIRQVEQLVNEAIRADYPRQERRSVPIAEARALGAMALFGEKYGEEVRVMQYGDSIELCGGTHVASTGRIGAFKIVGESSTAAGIRRVEAITGSQVEQHIYAQEDLLETVSALLNNAPNISKAVEKLIAEHTDLRKKVEEIEHQRALSLKADVLNASYKIGNTRVLLLEGEVPTAIAKNVAGMVRDSLSNESFILVVGTQEGDKCNLTVVLSKDLTEKGFNAAKLIASVAQLIKGGGGGQPHFAMAGGRNPQGLGEAVTKILKTGGWEK